VLCFVSFPNHLTSAPIQQTFVRPLNQETMSKRKHNEGDEVVHRDEAVDQETTSKRKRNESVSVSVSVSVFDAEQDVFFQEQYGENVFHTLFYSADFKAEDSARSSSSSHDPGLMSAVETAILDWNESCRTHGGESRVTVIHVRPEWASSTQIPVIKVLSKGIIPLAFLRFLRDTAAMGDKYVAAYQVMWMASMISYANPSSPRDPKRAFVDASDYTKYKNGPSKMLLDTFVTGTPAWGTGLDVVNYCTAMACGFQCVWKDWNDETVGGFVGCERAGGLEMLLVSHRFKGYL
jgi:hypothetical protein